jgi:hypothetical protein
MISDLPNYRTSPPRTRGAAWCLLGCLLLATAALSGCGGDQHVKFDVGQILRGRHAARHGGPPMPPPCYGYHQDTWRPWPCPDIIYEQPVEDGMLAEPAPEPEAMGPEEPAAEAPGEPGVEAAVSDEDARQAPTPPPSLLEQPPSAAIERLPHVRQTPEEVTVRLRDFQLAPLAPPALPAASPGPTFQLQPERGDSGLSEAPVTMPGGSWLERFKLGEFDLLLGEQPLSNGWSVRISDLDTGSAY